MEKYKFDLSYAEIDTIHNALSDYLDYLSVMIYRSGGSSDLIKETVAYNLYFKFRDFIDEFNEA